MAYKPGDLRPTGRGREVVVVAPTHCRNGDKLAPGNVLVSTELCAQGNGRYVRHYKWTCLTKGCGDVIIGDGHPDACAPTSHADLGQ